jgi:hypothetical protein
MATNCDWTLELLNFPQSVLMVDEVNKLQDETDEKRKEDQDPLSLFSSSSLSSCSKANTAPSLKSHVPCNCIPNYEV